MAGLYDDLGGTDAYEAKCNEGPHNWFFHTYTMENNLILGSTLNEVQRLAVFDLRDLWWDFCHESYSSEILPPPDSIAHAFWQYRQNIAAARSTTLCVAQNNLTYGNSREPAPIPVPPSARPTPASTLPPSRVPISDHARDRARPSVAQKALPPVTSLGDMARDPIVLSSPDSSPPLPATPPWTVVGGRSGHSYAKVAAKSTTPTAPPSSSPPTIRQAHAGSITAKQLNAMTKNQVVNAFNLRFSPRITASRHSKDGVIAAYLDRASRPVIEAAKPTPAPKPIQKTEYTLIRDPRARSIAGLSGRRGDAADLVRTIQRHIAQSGIPSPAQVIGRHWSNQTSYNFVLTFNGNPSHNEVLRLRSVFTKVFRPHHTITPSRGYTQVTMGFVPTMREIATDPLPSPQSLCREFSRNEVMKDLIIFGEPYWLTARNPENRLGSISFAFLDEDGSRLKDMTRNPPFMFGRQTRIRKFVSRPLIQQCQHCWSLDHATGNCHRGDKAIICPICGGAHSHEQHHGRCPNAAHHTDL